MQKKRLPIAVMTYVEDFDDDNYCTRRPEIYIHSSLENIGNIVHTRTASTAHLGGGLAEKRRGLCTGV